MEEGFSRYADDDAMNEHLKDELKAEDPMAAIIAKKREKVEIRKGLGKFFITVLMKSNRF